MFHKCAKTMITRMGRTRGLMIALTLGAALTSAIYPAHAAGASTAAQTAQSKQFYSPHLATQTAPMHVEVLNGNRFRDVATGDRYRLYGVDVCAREQKAVLDKQPWACGAVATAWLIKATLGQWVVCTTIRKDGSIKVARCATSRYPDVAEHMLDDGLAIMPPDAADQEIPAYKLAQNNARTKLSGLWGSKFQMPWDFRKNRVPAPPPSVSPDIPTLPTLPQQPIVPAAPKVTLSHMAPPAL